MSCQRTEQTDWAAYAADPQSEQWAELRAHYPLCEDCAPAAARWLALRTRLGAGGRAGSAHPGEEELLAYERSPDRLSAMRRSAITRHVQDCARCSNELIVLNRMLPALGAQRASTGAQDGRSLRERWLGWLPAPVPALGLAAVAITVALVVGLVLLPAKEEKPGERYVEERAPRPSPTPSPTPSPEAPPEASPTPPSPGDAPSAPESMLAQDTPAAESTVAEAPAPAAEPEFVDDASPPPERPAPQIAEVAPPPSSSPPEAERLRPPTGESPLVAGPPVQLAAAMPLEPPVYRADALLAGDELAPARSEWVIRAGGEAPAIRVLAPEHLAISFEPQPRLYWHLSAASDSPIELVVVERDSGELRFERLLPPPVSAGLHELDLAKTEATSVPGVAYQFFASIVVDEERRDLDRTSGFVFELRPEAAPAPGTPAARAHTLAAAGSWLDAFATLSQWLAEDPGLERARRHRAALADQASLPEVARDLRTRR